MARQKSNSRALRELAEEVVQKIAEPIELPDDDRRDLVTSLVRQWITYEGHATLFLGEIEVSFKLGKSPLGTLGAQTNSARHDWTSWLIEDWKISPEDLDDVFEQLNRGQSAEVTNADSMPVRVWVNPKERSRGVEPLVEQPVPSARNINYRKLADDVLKRQLVAGLNADEMDELGRSVAEQWQEFDGHACIFLDGRVQLVLTLTKRDKGGCDITAARVPVDLESLLSSIAPPFDDVSEVIADINLGLEVEFQDRHGNPSVLWHDPKARRIVVRKLNSASPQQQSDPLPIVCPKCNAVLKPWQAGERKQTCPQCGRDTSLS